MCWPGKDQSPSDIGRIPSIVDLLCLGSNEFRFSVGDAA